MTQASNVNRAIIKCTKDTVCKEFLDLLKSLHSLSESEILLASKFLEKRIELKEKISDDDMVDEYLQTPKVRASIKDAAKIKNMALFQNMMSALRRKGFFTDGDRIAKPFIPNINNDSKFFKIEFILKIDNVQNAEI